MKEMKMTFHCKMNGKTFRKYALFDTFQRRRRWRSPSIFALILGAFSAVCFLVQLQRGQFPLLGWVLLIIGLGLPLVYLGSFCIPLLAKTKKMDKAGKTIDYVVVVSSTGVTVTRKNQEEHWTWDDLVGAYRLDDMICLYPNPQQAFLLLPSDHGHNYDTAWESIASQLGTDRAFDRRKKR